MPIGFWIAIALQISILLAAFLLSGRFLARVLDDEERLGVDR
ncbi:hypothetical protein ACI79P_19445 [Blastococcus sp. SYSU DS0510]